jgi:hypothetical protein
MILLNRNHESSLEDYFFQCNNTQRKRYSGEKANEELLKLKYFTMPKKKPNLQKNRLKETKIFQDIITLDIISSFNTGQNIIFQKSSYRNRPIIT